MSYIIEQKNNKGRVYLYEVTSYWDKDKKQPRQKRKYIGPKHKRLNKVSGQTYKPRNIISRNFGNIGLLNKLTEDTGLKELLKEIFPDQWRDILGLAYYDIMDGEASFKYPYWLEEQYLPGVKKMYSPDISRLFDSIGGQQRERMEFLKKWTNLLKPINGIYYDITSISNYSGNIEFVEWGYNRDEEDLPQMNLGVVCCQEKSMPFYYTIFPGSIVDVTTINNNLKILDVFGLKEIILIMDRGFCSTNNINLMNSSGMLFIQPLSFSMKKAKELVNENRIALHDTNTAFRYNEEIVYHVLSDIKIGNVDCDAHVFLNEKAEVSQKHLLLVKLFETEQKFKDKKFISKKEFEKYFEDFIPEKLRKYFQWNKQKKQAERNQKVFNDYLANLGYVVFASNKKGLDKSYVLDCYRHKDDIEKIFDILKNELDGDRLRVHSKWNIEGKLFVKFIAMILYMKISHVMKKNNLFKKYSLKELLLEMRKIKIIKLGDSQPMISEFSKKQKAIIDVFNLNLLHSY